jgi:hypothetical protein
VSRPINKMAFVPRLREQLLFFKAVRPGLALTTSISQSICKDPPRRKKNSQPATARRVAMKMGRRLSRGRGIGYVSIQVCSLITASPARTTLPAAHFDCNQSHVIYGTGHTKRNPLL